MVIHAHTQALRIYSDAAELSAGAAEEICQHANIAISARGRFVWVLSGGKTPQAVYEALVSPTFRHRLDWSRVEFFWADERAVPPDHPDSNFHNVYHTLLQPLGIDLIRIHRMRGESEDLAQAAVEYERDIADCLQASEAVPVNTFDLVTLGLGEDAHTASLFPATEALTVEDRAVVANEVPQLNTWRLTLTAQRLKRSLAVLFIVSGENKASAVSATLQGPRNFKQYPAQFFERAEWFIDRAAAAQLTAT